jgi:hypothetical protein
MEIVAVRVVVGAEAHASISSLPFTHSRTPSLFLVMNVYVSSCTV